MLAAVCDVARLEHRVDRLLHRRDGAPEARELGLRVLGNDLADDDARLVQHSGRYRQPAMDADAVEPHRLIADEFGRAGARAG